MDERLYQNEEVTLLELLDRLLDKGIVIAGDLVISIANIDLIYVGLRLLVCSVETLENSNSIEVSPI